jgi:hypothetical protein
MDFQLIADNFFRAAEANPKPPPNLIESEKIDLEIM